MWNNNKQLHIETSEKKINTIMDWTHDLLVLSKATNIWPLSQLTHVWTSDQAHFILSEPVWIGSSGLPGILTPSCPD